VHLMQHLPGYFGLLLQFETSYILKMVIIRSHLLLICFTGKQEKRITSSAGNLRNICFVCAI